MKKNISADALRALPPNANFIGFDTVTDMDGDRREAMIWLWLDNGYPRTASFTLDTGDYLGEYNSRRRSKKR